MKTNIRSLFVVLFSVFVVSLTFAALPEFVTYQGHVVDSQGTPLTGPFDVTFRIYDRDGAAVGEEIWKETQAGVPIADGNFSVKIGSAAAQSAQPLRELAFDKPYWIGIEIASLGELSPRQSLEAVPFAYRVHNGVTLSEDQIITGNKTFTGTTTFAQLTPDAQKGDLFVQGAGGLERLLPGPAGQFLKSLGANASPAWSSIPFVQVGFDELDADQSIGSEADLNLSVGITSNHPQNPILAIAHLNVTVPTTNCCGEAWITKDGVKVSFLQWGRASQTNLPHSASMHRFWPNGFGDTNAHVLKIRSHNFSNIATTHKGGTGNLLWTYLTVIEFRTNG